MSPERIGGDHGDQRTDIYALSCVLYEMLTGRKPFDGEIFAVMYAHVHTPPPAVSTFVPDAPKALDDVVRKGMAKNPDDRYPTAGSLAMAARAALKAARSQQVPATRMAPPPSPPATRMAPSPSPPATPPPPSP